MQKLVFTNGGGQSIDLTSGNFGITNWEGFSNTELNIQTQQVPFQDGGVFLDALMEQREISVTVAIQDNNDLSLRYELKRQLISALNPKLGEGVLVYTNDYLSRQIKAVPQLPIFENKNSNDAGTLKASVVFSCPSPYWEDLEDTVVTISQGDIPEIINDGDVDVPVKAEFVTTNVTNPTLINTENEKKIEYSGTLETNMVVDTNSGKKQCYENNIDFIISIPSGFDIITFSEKQGLFVVAGETFVMTSYDYKKWSEIKTSPIYIHDLKWDKYREVYILIGAITTHSGSSYTTENVIYKTADFENYEEINTGLALPRMNNITITQDRIVIGCDGSVIVSNSDLTSWQQYTVSNTNFIAIIYANYLNKYVSLVAISGNRRIMTSTDGQNWEITGSLNNANSYDSIAYSESKNIFVIMRNGSTNWASSSDSLETWTFKTLSYISYGLCYSEADEQFIALSIYQDKFRITKSKNGTTINTYTTPSIVKSDSNLPITSINTTYYSEMFNVYINIGRQIITSTDANNWECRTSYMTTTGQSGNNAIYDSIYDRFIITNGNRILVSKDKKHFKLIGTVPNSVYKLIIYNSQYFAVTYTSIIKSTDLVNWEMLASYFNYQLETINYGFINNTEYLVVAGVNNDNHNTVVITSADGGNTWVERATNIIGYLYDVTIANNMIVAVGQTRSFIKPLVIYSANMTSWTEISNFTEGGALFSVLYKNKSFVTVSSYGGVYKSKYGDTWEKIADTINAQQIIYSEIHRAYFVVGYGIVKSQNLLNWQDVSSDKITRVTSIAVSNKNTDILTRAETIAEYSVDEKGENLIDKLSSDSDMNFKLLKGSNIIRIAKSSGDFLVILSYRQKYIGV